MSESAYPLSWPAGWKRTTASERKRARFNSQRDSRLKQQLTVAQALRRLQEALGRMGVSDWNTIISTNVELRRDGLPYSGQKEPQDPGAAVYWRDSSQDGWPRRCMAIDLYDRVADNLAAIAATLEYLRGIERHGGAAILDRAFTGFTALEHSPGRQQRTWRDVLGVEPGDQLSEVKAKYRRLACVMHPDKGGSDEAMAELNEAMAQAVKELM